MPLSLDARMQMIGPISQDHAEAARPTVGAWAVRAENLAAFCNRTLSPETSPITAFVSSEVLWRKPS
ncbi:hypothetical protein ADU59_09920 [Pararhizobium polonicum]|uniref:Uncharacterized protein n=1 Tax=Pararhizobium polonicum TaxID=1612624 RepID=A0A1C7P359_9HYPH|nr:hypothetical protein ADU59_09920 [Pararhizobium polonicum]